LDLFCPDFVQQEAPMGDPAAARRGIEHVLREAERREQFLRARAETATFGELADLLNRRQVPPPFGRRWTSAGVARFALT
jgi:hypothetical protein